MAAIRDLIGLTVSKLEEVHDYIQITFSDVAVLSIFNNYTYDGGAMLSIEGKRVKSINVSDKAVIVIFEGGTSLSIGLNDVDYNGPEAMVLRQEGKPPVVWS